MIEKNNKLSEVFNYLESIINERSNSDKKSYTAELLKKGLDRISQKVGEEAIEVVISSSQKNKKQVIYESADLIFHLLVLWKKLDIECLDIAEELMRRKNDK